jgi:N-acetyl-alpha-D-muramate 1-phosphate uridylyltransferase
MLLAAGLGTRLRPLTDTIPKALVEVHGVPILRHVALRLIEAGADRLIVNTHHLGDRVERYLREQAELDVEVRISPEPEVPLETGGGLLHARPHFRADLPFFLHNADILTDADLRALYRQHLGSSPLATVAVMERASQRYLLFDQVGLLGRVDEGKRLRIQAREPVGETIRLGFAGVHVISPEIFDLFEETGAFSILDTYLRLVGTGHRILPFRIDGVRWLDIGRPEHLERARAEFQNG